MRSFVTRKLSNNSLSNQPVIIKGKNNLYGKQALRTKKVLRKMKLVAILLLAFNLQISAGNYEQTVTLSANNETLETIFGEINKQTGFDFLYNDTLMKYAKRVSIHVKDVPVTEALDICFKDQPFTYNIEDKMIRLIPGPVTSGENVGKEENVDIAIQVTDESGIPLAGATVSIKGTTFSDAANGDGKLKLYNINKWSVLVVSNVDYETQEVSLAGRGFYNVKLKRRESQLDHVVIVATGYQDIPKERATGSFVKINNDLLNKSVSRNITSRLEGNVSGLIFNRLAGSPNILSISIRGLSTINSGSEPLIIVDNFPYEGDINNINPNDVESITILKDAAATSIWGTKAGNGVIVITTKKGRYNQKTRVTINSNFTITRKTDLLNQQAISARDFMEVEKFLFEKGHYDDLLNFIPYAPVTAYIRQLYKNKNGQVSETELAAFENSLVKNDIRNDYMEYLYQNATDQQYAINMSGGCSNISYLISIGYDRSVTNLVGNNSDRVTIGPQLNIKPVKNFEIRAGLRYTLSRYKNNSPGGALPLPPYERLVDDNGNARDADIYYRKDYTDTVGNGNLLNWKYSPLDELGMADNQTTSDHIFLNVEANYRVNRLLNASVKYMLEKQRNNDRQYYSVNSFRARDLINLFTPPDLKAWQYSAIPYGGILDRATSELESHNFRAQLNFNTRWGNLHEISAIGGAELGQKSIKGNSDRLYGYDENIPGFGYVDLAEPKITIFGFPAAIPDNLSINDRLNRRISVFANAAYVYDNRYRVSLSARRDAANIFGANTNRKWKPLWSAGLGWNISKEKFYKSKIVPELNIKTTLGTSGNSDNGTVGILTFLRWPSNGANVLVYDVNSAPNPDLRWEQVQMFNFAIEFSGPKKIISGSLEVYYKRSTDLISTFRASPASGYSYITMNSVSMKSNGFDLDLAVKVLDKKIKWDLSGFVSYNTDKVTRYLTDLPPVNHFTGSTGKLIAAQGITLYPAYSYRWGGLDPSSGDPRGYIGPSLSNNVDSIFANTTLNDLVFHGSVRPRIFGAVRNTITWKRFAVSAIIMYKLKFFFRNPDILSYNKLFNNQQPVYYGDFSNRWQKPGDELITDVPSMVYPSPINRDLLYQQSEATILRGDHIRLQNIHVSYLLKQDKNKNEDIPNINFYINLNNIGILWKANKAGLDPDFGTTPSMSISFGIKAGF